LEIIIVITTPYILLLSCTTKLNCLYIDISLSYVTASWRRGPGLHDEYCCPMEPSGG
jgi:hypothetical protein